MAALALETSERSSELQQTVWTYRANQLDTLTDMAQEEDGAIWVGAKSGLYRFDTQTFEPVPIAGISEPTGGWVFRLFAPSHGGLWVGTGGTHKLAFMKGGKTRIYGEQDGLPPGLAMAFAQQSDGTMWVGTRGGLARLRGDRWETIDASWDWPGGPALTLMFDSSDRLWIRSDEKIFSLSVTDHRVTRFHDRGCGCGLNFLESPAGIVYLVEPEGLERLATAPASGRARWSTPTSALADGAGTLWIRPSQRILRAASLDAADTLSREAGPNLLRFGQNDPKLPGWGEFLFRDREGNLWSLARSGIIRFKPKIFHQLVSIGTWPDVAGQVRWPMVALPHGGLLFSDGSQHGVFESNGGPLTRRQFPESVSSVAPSRNGGTWVAGSRELWRLTGQQTERFLISDAAHSAGIRVSPFRAMAEDREGGVWMSDYFGRPYHFSASSPTQKGSLPVPPGRRAAVICSDKAGRVWFGYVGRDDLAMLDGTTVREFGAADGLHVGQVRAVYGSRGSVWVGGSDGLSRFDGHRFQTVTTADPDALREVSGIVETAEGDVWINSWGGILKLPAPELALSIRRSRPVWAEVFDANDGIEGDSLYRYPAPALVEGDDGRLWASTSEGIFAFDPRRIERGPVHAARIKELSVDDRSYPVQGVQQLPIRAKSLKFTYGGGSLSSADKLRYRYRMDGVDDDWRSAGQELAAYYMNLAPGRYRFRVQVTRAGAPWPAAETALELEIPPAFTQTRLFEVICAALAALVIWQLVQWRSRQLAKPLRIRFEARLAERVRIARDLHDTLLQSMHGLVLYVQGVARRLEPDHPERAGLEEALQIGNDGLREGRDRILGLRLQDRMSDSLSDSLAAVGEQSRMQGGNARFVLEVRGAPVPVLPDVREEVYGIAREAIVNAFRHAQAKSISVRLDYSAKALAVSVRDDGRGIESDVVARRRPGHWGLSGMSERAHQIGAVLTIRGAPAQGTTVELRVPAMQAFGRPAGWRSRRLWRSEPRLALDVEGAE